MAETIHNHSDNTGTGVILGIIIAALLVIAAFMIFGNGFGGDRTTNIDMPDVKMEAPDVKPGD